MRIFIAIAALSCFIPFACASDPWVDAVVDASASLDGSGLYNDPESLLGEPTRTFIDPFSGDVFRASVVSAAVNRDEQGRKTVVTLRRGEFIKVRFDEPVEDDPRNAFGVDLIVFGNAFFPADGIIDPDSDMGAVSIIGGAFSEPVTVAVSTSGMGDPFSHPEEWHVFDAGPHADGLFPTNAFLWDECAGAWAAEADFCQPVDPALGNGDFVGGSAAEAIGLYGISGGGTGFDLAASGFESIQYVYLTSEGGEVDALADVAPAPAASGDVDRDGDVDLVDFARLQECWTGSGGGVGRCECRSANFDADGDVDFDDYAIMHATWSGPR
ncbi:MAG: hypothetical protein IT449_14155 [Phycisphaerales bacterium]|nr:hypothetical protein [Phycisphaerales bacterium]